MRALMATVGLAPTRSYILRMRQKATRMPYSCQLQFGRSGSCGVPCGGLITMRAIGRDRSQSSSDSTGHTTRRMPSGRRSGGRSGSGVKGRRSRGCMTVDSDCCRRTATRIAANILPQA